MNDSWNIEGLANAAQCERRPVIAYAGTNTTTGLEFFRCTEELGFAPLLLDADPTRLPFEAPAHTFRLQPLELSMVVDTVRSWRAYSGRVAGITSNSDATLLLAAEAADVLGLPGPQASGIASCRNKVWQRRQMQRARVTQPAYTTVDSVGAAIAAANLVGYPCVTKPVDGTGSISVRQARSEAELASNANALLAGSGPRPAGKGVRGIILVEQYIEGREFSIEVWAGHALGVTGKLVSAPPVFVEVGHTFPAPGLDPSLACDLCVFAERACKAIGIVFGAAHVEVRLVGRTPYLIEVNPRLAGGFIPRLLELTGHDLIRATVLKVAGMPATTQLPAIAPSAGIRFIIPPRSGRLIAVHNIDRVRNTRGVADVRMYVPLGRRVDLRGDFRDRLGHVVAVGETPDIAAANADRALAMLNVCVEPAMPVAAGVSAPHIEGGVS